MHALTRAVASVHLSRTSLAPRPHFALSQRKLAAISLLTALSLDASVVDLVGEILSYCVSVIAETAETVSPSKRSHPQRPPAQLAASEHAIFHRRAEACALDPLVGAPLLHVLQSTLLRAKHAHGAAFEAQMAAIDPTLLEQVKDAFDFTA
eukprot:6210785-Pleurochrysis_carterae.AAC.2